MTDPKTYYTVTESDGSESDLLCKRCKTLHWQCPHAKEIKAEHRLRHPVPDIPWDVFLGNLYLALSTARPFGKNFMEEDESEIPHSPEVWRTEYLYGPGWNPAGLSIVLSNGQEFHLKLTEKKRERQTFNNAENCPGCDWGPGRGINPRCKDPRGCGHWREVSNGNS